MGVTGCQPLGRTFLEPWSWQKQEPQRKVPVAHVNLDGVPSHPGPIKVSGIHLPTVDQGGDGGSGLTKAVLAVWHRKLLSEKFQP